VTICIICCAILTSLQTHMNRLVILYDTMMLMGVNQTDKY